MHSFYASFVHKIFSVIFVKTDVEGVANRMVYNLVLEDMALIVLELVVFHIEPLKQRVGLPSNNSIML